MLPIFLVLVAATSALAAPSIGLGLRSINDVARQNVNGINAALTDSAFEIIDGGDFTVYTISAQAVLNDLANRKDPVSRAYALGPALAILSTLVTGVPGDACAQASVIDAYVNAGRSRPGAAAGAVRNYVQSLIAGIDLIVQYSSNPNSLRYSTGQRGGCGGSGRTYAFEAAWDSILSNVPADSASLLNEQYCSAKRLYNAFNIHSNIVGASITASSLEPLNVIFQRSLEPLSRFLAAVAQGSGAAAAAGPLKQALQRAA